MSLKQKRNLIKHFSFDFYPLKVIWSANYQSHITGIEVWVEVNNHRPRMTINKDVGTGLLNKSCLTWAII